MTRPLRHISLQGSSNLRDIGGYATGDGRRVKWGRVYRSGALWGLTSQDWEWMRERNFSGVCDLRSDAERDLGASAWPDDAIPETLDQIYAASLLFTRQDRGEANQVGALEKHLYVRFATLLAPSFKRLFHALRTSDGPVLVHCTAGQDRTGLAIGLLLGMLGVERATIHEDYLLSTEWRRPEFEMDFKSLNQQSDHNAVARFYRNLIAGQGPEVLKPKRLIDADGTPLIEVALSSIDTEWGSVEGYLNAEVGMGPREIEDLRTNLLEPA